MGRVAKNKTIRQRTKRTTLGLSNRGNPVIEAKVFQPLESNANGDKYAPCLKIVKEEGVDKFVITTDTNTVPSNRPMKYIQVFRCDRIDIHISKNDISALWKQLHERFMKSALIVVISRNVFHIEDDPAMMDMALHIVRSMRHIGHITICEQGSYISLLQKNVYMDNPFAEHYEQKIQIMFPMSCRFSTESIISLIKSAPFSKLCHIVFLEYFDSVLPAIAAFALTQLPVPGGVFTKLGDGGISFELAPSGTKLYVSDRKYSASYDYNGFPTSLANDELN